MLQIADMSFTVVAEEDAREARRLRTEEQHNGQKCNDVPRDHPCMLEPGSLNDYIPRSRP